MLPSRQTHDVLLPVDHDQLAVFIQNPSSPVWTQPSGVQGLSSGLFVFIIAFETDGPLDQDFPGIGNLQVHFRHGGAHGIQFHAVIAVAHRQPGDFGLPVNCLMLMPRAMKKLKTSGPMGAPPV